MLAVAKAIAIRKGVRFVPTPDEKVVYGYLLRTDEIHAAFKEEGFRKMPTIDSYIDTWIELGYVLKVDWRNHSPCYFFLLQTSVDGAQLQDLIIARDKNTLDAEDCLYVGTEVTA